MEPTSDSRAAIPLAATTGELRQLGAGTTLGRYRLLRKVAAGGMAEVYAARSHGISGFEKKVAIKKILPQHSLNKRFIDMLVDEAKISVSLTHPNIAQVYELGLEGDTYYIVMEYVDGRPLNRILQKVDSQGPDTIPIEHAVYIMSEVAKGLHHAHNQRDARGRALSIVHRDVSPQNVLISYQGDVKLIDFGIARAEGRAAQTTAGYIKGKLRYLAPEIAMGEEPDHRADIYCCGIVLFELLTGEAMFAPRTDVEAVEMASAAKVRSPRSANPDVPHELEEIVMRALRKERDDRYPNAKGLYTDLRRFLNQRYPSYVGSELGDYMQMLFTQEIAEEHRLDSLAEKIAFEESVPRVDEKPADPSQPGSDSDGKGYRQIVTRVGVPAVTAAPSDPAPEPKPGEEKAGLDTSPLAFEARIRDGDDVSDEARAAEPTVAAPPPTSGARTPRVETPEVGGPLNERPSFSAPTELGEAKFEGPATEIGAPAEPEPRPARPRQGSEITVDVERIGRGPFRSPAWIAAIALAIIGGIALGFAVVGDPTPPAVGGAVSIPPEQQPAAAPVVASPEAPSPATPPREPAPLQPPQEPPPPQTAKAPQPAQPQAPTRVKEPAGKGTLVINSEPYSMVFVNDRSYGNTPVTVTLEADTYRVVLQRPKPDGRKLVVSRTIRAGKKSVFVHKWVREGGS